MNWNQYRPALGVCLTRGFVPQSRSSEFKEQRKGEGAVCSQLWTERGGMKNNKTHTHETNRKRCSGNQPVALSRPSCQDVIEHCVTRLCVCVCRCRVAELRCRYLSGLVAWRSGGRWRRPEGGSPSLVRGCCWEESWPVATSPFWASATHTHTRFFVRT